MANTNATYAALEKATPPERVPAAFRSGKLRVMADKITFAGQAAADTFTLGKLPAGAVVHFGAITVDTSTGSATLAIGTAASAAKYKAAAAVTTTNVPQFFGVRAGLGTPLTTEEEIIVTTAAASLPASGGADVVIGYSLD